MDSNEELLTRLIENYSKILDDEISGEFIEIEAQNGKILKIHACFLIIQGGYLEKMANEKLEEKQRLFGGNGRIDLKDFSIEGVKAFRRFCATGKLQKEDFIMLELFLIGIKFEYLNLIEQSKAYFEKADTCLLDKKIAFDAFIASSRNLAKYPTLQVVKNIAMAVMTRNYQELTESDFFKENDENSKEFLHLCEQLELEMRKIRSEKKMKSYFKVRNILQLQHGVTFPTFFLDQISFQIKIFQKPTNGKLFIGITVSHKFSTMTFSCKLKGRLIVEAKNDKSSHKRDIDLAIDSSIRVIYEIEFIDFSFLTDVQNGFIEDEMVTVHYNFKIEDKQTFQKI